MDNIGKRFKNVRKMLNLSQAEFANSLGVTKQAISNFEHSRCVPSTAIMRKMLLNYNVNLNYLISEVGNVFNNQDMLYKSIRTSLLDEIKTFLESKGI